MTFLVLEGIDKGRVFRDLPIPMTIGREEGNALRLNDEKVSRYHAKVQMEDKDVILTDLDSTNGTRVNGAAIQIRRLRPGDQVSIGRTVLLFGTMEEIAARRASSSSAGGRPRPLPAELGRPAEYRAGRSERSDSEVIRGLLDTTSVFCEEAGTRGLLAAVLDPVSTDRVTLARGFHRMVVVDASPGVTPGGFDEGRFVAEICREVGGAFGLALDPSRFHNEDVFQVLKDEPCSLFCFAHFELIPARCMPYIRAFTQGVHRVLCLNEGPRELEAEEEGGESSVVSDAVVSVSGGSRPAAEGSPRSVAPGGTVIDLPNRSAGNFATFDDVLPVPHKLTPAQAARLTEIFDYLHRGLTSAIEIIDSYEDGTEVKLGFAEWQTIQAVQMFLARYSLALTEPK